VAASLKSPVTSIPPVKLSSPSGVIFPSGIFSYFRGLEDYIMPLKFPSRALTGLATSLKWLITPIFSSEAILLRISMIEKFFFKTSLQGNFSPHMES
jgi:hypothetical protein